MTSLTKCVVLVTFAIALSAVSCQLESDYYTDPEYDHDNLEASQNVTLSPLERAGEALRKLQNFIDKTIERVIKDMLPTVVRSGQETDTSPKCMNAMMSMIGGIRTSQVWAFQSELLIAK